MDQMLVMARQKLLAWGVGTTAAGLLILGIGFLMLTYFPAIAGAFGARLAFGLPWSDLDAQKLRVAAFAASMVLAYGAVVVGCGVALISRSRPQPVPLHQDR